MDSMNAEDKFSHGNALLSDGFYSEAAERFGEVIDQCPDMEGAWGNRGYALLEIGRDEEALSDFDMVIRINPGDPFGHGYKSMAMYNLGRYAEALDAAARAIELAEEEEDVPPARLVRSWLFIRSGQYEYACDDLEFYLEYNEDEAVRDLYDICVDVRETGEKLCSGGPEGQLRCASCLNSGCGFSLNLESNPDWRVQDGICQYAHCVETMPQRNGQGEGICPVFFHDCPGGPATIAACEAARDRQGIEIDDD